MSAIATVDLSRWHAGGGAADAVAAEVDEGLQRAGFILVTGHGVDPGLAARGACRQPGVLRAARRRQAALLGAGRRARLDRSGRRGQRLRRRHRDAAGPQGELQPGRRDRDRRSGRRPDLVRAQRLARRGAVAAGAGRRVHRCDAPGRPTTCSRCSRTRSGCPATRSPRWRVRPTWTMNINHYPPVSVVGEPEPGQFRIGPHTDFGTVTVLDREPGAGGLQVYSEAEGWEDAPYDPAALTVNIGDLLEYWSGRRWPSGRHRVLPPQPHAPEEDLVSLIYFYEANHDALVTPLEPPIGRVVRPGPGDVIGLHQGTPRRHHRRLADPSPGRRRRRAGQRVRVQHHVARAEVLLEVTDRAGARDQQRVGGVRQQPGEPDLRWRGPEFVGDAASTTGSSATFGKPGNASRAGRTAPTRCPRPRRARAGPRARGRAGCRRSARRRCPRGAPGAGSRAGRC